MKDYVRSRGLTAIVDSQPFSPGSGKARMPRITADSQDDLRVHLTECINQMVLESQLLHKIVNTLFTISDQTIR